MSKHTPYIVIPQGVFASSILYKVAEGENPLYHRYAEGTLNNMIELANRLNYEDARQNGELAVCEKAEEPVVAEADGIPSISPDFLLRATIRKLDHAIGESDRGRVNLPGFKVRVSEIVEQAREELR